MSEFTQLFDLSPDVFFWQDMHGVVQDCNKTACKQFGFKFHEQMVGTTFFDFPCPAVENAEDFDALDQQAIINNESVVSIISGRFAHGQNISLVKKTPIIKQGKTVGLLKHSQVIGKQHSLGAISAYLSSKNTVDTANITSKIHIISDKDHTFSLSSREEECLFYLLYGKTMREIADILYRSMRTVEAHLRNIKQKMHCQNKSELIEKAIAYGYMDKIPRAILSKDFILIL